MARMLRLAIEGESIEIVEGMFVAVPLTAAEDVRAISTEAFGETIKNAAAKVWEHLAKLIAGIVATVKGVAKWLLARLKGDKGRKVNQEIVHQYEVLEESIRNFKSADPESKMESIARTDGFAENASRSLSVTAHALLDDPKAYLGAVGAVEKMMDKQGQQRTIEGSSMLVALAKVGPDHPFNQQEGERVNAEVAKIHAHFERLPEYLGIIRELIASSYQNKTGDRLPTNPSALAELLGAVRDMLSGSATVDTFERWSKEITLIEKDVEQAQKHTEAHLRVVKDEAGQSRARAMLAGYAAFWKEMQPILKALSMLDQLRHGAFQLTDTVIGYWKKVVERTMAEYKDQEAVLSRIVELDRVFQAEAKKLKQLVGM